MTWSSRYRRRRATEFFFANWRYKRNRNRDGEAPLVDTSSSTVSSLVNEQQVQNLPLNGRSYDNLITLTPGISNSNAAWGPGNSGKPRHDRNIRNSGVPGPR